MSLSSDFQNIRVLVLDNNRIEGSLRDVVLPARLQRLFLNRNRITELPRNLPSGLTHVYANRNLLNEMPVGLGRNLSWLEIENNRISSLPDDIAERFPRAAIYLRGNPLSQRVLANLHGIMTQPGYRGSQLYFSMGDGRGVPSRPLEEAVRDWFVIGAALECKETNTSAANAPEAASAASAPAIPEVWKKFVGVNGAGEFQKFLDRLRIDNVNFARDETGQYRRQVFEWLTAISGNQELIQNAIDLARSSTEACEDRVSLTWNNMQEALVAHHMENGFYDAVLSSAAEVVSDNAGTKQDRIHELPRLARQTFRRNELERIAWKKVSELKLCDDVEVLLAYQHKAWDRLDLGLGARDMRWYSVSWLKDEDIENAVFLVREAEKAQFVEFLSADWEPWRAVLRRQMPNEYKAAKEGLENKLAGEYFEREVEDELETMGFPKGTADVGLEARVGSMITRRLTVATYEGLTRTFLRSRNLEHLLDEDVDPSTIGSASQPPRSGAGKANEDTTVALSSGVAVSPTNPRGAEASGVTESEVLSAPRFDRHSQTRIAFRRQRDGMASSARERVSSERSGPPARADRAAEINTPAIAADANSAIRTIPALMPSAERSNTNEMDVNW
ncbi:NEL-type E3 ubiquitin ligase domain-containing protein [Burkholderia sp. Nafp2/4-1b]|uniref:NEL-type E3 ubiquitin ligase domain-containing protein n=1 Tax=Burkholderia sp. Nafp2/4-1b TaxID=2116686 RepID=UPI0013CEA0DC|nr:NEL-type E3 ubiquitin ligase domain-containing protein [Burkholderia sp. Nafp2/4-1b]